MDKKIAGLIGAVSAFAAIDGAQAATAPQANDVMAVTSYADLLQPIPNATALLKESNAALAAKAAEDNQAKVEVAQYYYHHHHHHHHRFFRPFFHHHHHHHRYYNHHHHHHHHHHGYYAPY